ncbi:hypothetical protein [Legionella londiniensis]|uniref:Secreted protein n=1 Tax=Legionella londiniensis TaxID=45068 RepID=A0A0W0VI28_9GAMM|nr:hypothetical protein [Legionella londiniensis]KTD19777.1 hypothetical protein Llon_1949 [Legionella londiniensis]STX92312.1 Uncharacterised protein [Legionella londiniensis]
MKKIIAFFLALAGLAFFYTLPAAYAYGLQADIKSMESPENDAAPLAIPDNSDHPAIQDNNGDDEDDEEDADESDPMLDPDPEADVIDSGTPRAQEL